MNLIKHAKSLIVAAFAIALVCVAFAFTTKASAATVATGVTAKYNPATDTIDFSAETDQTLSIYVLKDATTAMTGKEKVKATVVVSGGAASLVLNDSKKGLKAAENKSLYLYVAVSGAAITAEANLTANFKLAGTDVKKIDSVVFNYAKTYKGSEDTVLAVKATGTAEGATSQPVSSLANIIIMDSKGKAKDKTLVETPYTGESLTGDALYGIITDEGKDAKGKLKSVKHTLSVRVKGTNETVTVDGVVFDGQRNSKAKAVSPKAPAKAVKVKVDFLKGTIALKSGLDFVVRTAEVTTAAAISATEWKTILPSDATNGTNENKYVDSTDYLYVKKLTETSTTADKNSFYKGDKIKLIDLAEICSAAWDDPSAVSNTAIIYVRKTATDKAPASKESETAIKVTKAAVKPVIEVTTGGAVKANYDAKKGFTLASADIKGANKNGGYEYLVVTKKQFEAKNIDFSNSKWAKLVPGKPLKTTLASSVVYKTKVGDLTKEKISTVDTDKNLIGNGSIYILIRGAGVKENTKTKTSGALPTDYVITTFITSDKTVQWQIVDIVDVEP